MSQVIAGTISLLLILGFGGLLWYKIKSTAPDNSGVVAAQIKDQAAAKISLDKVIAEKNEQERQELDVKVKAVKLAGDRLAALELLAKLRGVR